MFLSIRNLGKVKSAEIEIAGITVIAGENNTGKSTLGEALFSVFNCFHDPESRIRREKSESIYRILNKLRYGDMRREQVILSPGQIRGLSEFFVSEDGFKGSKPDIYDALLKEVVSNGNERDGLGTSILEDIDLAAKQIHERLLIQDEEFFNEAMSSALNEEFNGQINNIYSGEPAYIGLTVRNQKTEIVIIDDEVESLEGIQHLNTEAVYLDDPFILDGDFSRSGSLTGHWGHARHNIRKGLTESSAQENLFDYIATSKKLEDVYSIIDSICDGRIVRKGSDYNVGYAVSDSDKILNVKNLSSGLKTFAIIKQFLLNGTIEENGTLILDEPEIHLHPEWQLLFAELIVILQREFGLHILLNTHSPYFLNAIQVYAQKYDIQDGCRYYQAISEGVVSIVEDVTDNVENIYAKLAAPFQVLETEAYDV